MRRLPFGIRYLAVFAAFLVLLLGITTAVFADSPHFISSSASGPDSTGSLTVSFKEAGLDNNMLINYEATADATATYACINGGGNHPQAANKETVSGPDSATGSFPSDKNGNVVASLVIAPLSAGGFSCPPGQTLVLASVSYSNVAITDETNAVSESISGTFSGVYVVV
jgi:hypothetical protein